MSRRRYLSALAGNVGDNISSLSNSLLNNELITRRQTAQNQQQMLKEMLDTFNNDVKGLTDPAQVEKYGPDVMTQRYQMLRKRMPKSLDSMIGDAPDFSSMDNTPQERLAPVRKTIDTATTPEAVPTGQSVLSQFLENRVTPSENFGDLTRMLGEAQGKRADLLAGQPRETIESIDPATGAKRAQFLTEREQGQVGPLQTERTAGQEASRQGAITGATAQATQDVQNNPTNQAGQARGAGMKAGAERQAQLKAEMNTMGLTSNQQSAALQLSDDFEKASGNFFAVRDSLKQLQSLGKMGSPISDTAMIFNFMKAMDPASSVREGEQAQVRNAAGIPERIRAYYNKTMDGNPLTPNERKDIIATAADIYTTKKTDQDKVTADFTQRAAQMRVPPQLVVREPQPLNTAPQAATPGSQGQPNSALQEILKRAQ